MKSISTVNVDPSLINEFFQEKKIELPLGELTVEEPTINSFLILKHNSTSAIVKYLGDDKYELLEKREIKAWKLKAKDAKQAAYIDLLYNNQIKLLTVTGPAGCGKTLLALAYALEQVSDAANTKNQINLLLTKPTETVKASKFFGAVPGTVDEKYGPFLDSFEIAFSKITKDNIFWKVLKEKNLIKFKPIEFMRGDTYDNTIIIADEMQNLDWHSTNTLLSRLGENSKIILLADILQKDINQNKLSGIELLNQSTIFNNSSITGSIELDHNYRSEISKLIGTIDKEVRSRI